jgi:hypothetical protein
VMRYDLGAARPAAEGGGGGIVGRRR